MLTINDLTKGTIFLINDQPHVVLELNHSKIGRGGAVLKTKVKNLITGNTIGRNFKQADHFEEAKVDRKKFLFLYSHKGQYCFVDEHDRSRRLFFQEEKMGTEKAFLKPNSLIEAEFFRGEMIRVILPIKMDFVVTEAPPGIKGNTAEGGRKLVTLETSATVQTPLFIETGDVIRVNTETGEYVERIQKAD